MGEDLCNRNTSQNMTIWELAPVLVEWYCFSYNIKFVREELLRSQKTALLVVDY